MDDASGRRLEHEMKNKIKQFHLKSIDTTHTVSDSKVTTNSVFNDYDEHLKISDYRTDILIQEQVQTVTINHATINGM